MNTIQIVLNSDRCHASVNGTPEATFMFFQYEHKNEGLKKDHAINDAKVECFNILARFQEIGVDAKINTEIVTK